MARNSYPDLHSRFDWSEGVHKAPTGYEHPWLVVTEEGTAGYWSRSEAREAWRAYRREGRPVWAS
jgi:hypothetical protein